MIEEENLEYRVNRFIRASIGARTLGLSRAQLRDRYNRNCDRIPTKSRIDKNKPDPYLDEAHNPEERKGESDHERPEKIDA